jgi:Ca2+-binding RTX toxin-like protein
MAIVYGTNGPDFINALDGVTNGADQIFGHNGSDTLKGLGGDDWILGGEGADTIYGGSGTDRAYYHDSYQAVYVNLASGDGVGGTADGDRLFDVEEVFGSVHDDLLVGDDRANSLYGYGGHDVLKGGGGADRLKGDGGNDTLEGGAGADTLEGGAGADTLYGDSGIDTMRGGAGDDVYYVDSGDSATEYAGEGYDVVYSSALGYTLTDHVEVLSLTGSGAVYGTGNAQANTIYGNAGDNVLEGGGGADQLNGLGGNDNFVFRPGDANGDVIHEFVGNGAGVGDFMYFIGYGAAAQGASFVQLSATTWQINSADGLTHDVITFGAGSAAIDPGDFVFI